MLDSTIQYLVQVVGQLLLQEVKLLLGVEGVVEDLASQLHFINAFLKNSEGKRDENHVVRELIRQIIDVAQEAENHIEHFMLAVERQKRGTFWGKVSQGANYVSTLHDMAEKTKKINKTITNIYDNFQLYKINMNGAVNNNDPAYPCPKSSVAVQRRRRDVEKDMVGLKDEADNITKKLTSGRQELDFVSIVGMGGLGKTTLVQKIYDDAAIRSHFTCRGWVFVSQEYDTRQVVLDIIKNVMPESTPRALKEKSLEELRDMLYNHLWDKTYLVVLDDIWKPEIWDEISQCFPNGDKHSRIMITARDKKVADRICPDSALPLRNLSFEEGWELFSRKVFRGGACPPGLKLFGEKIVAKCKGLPLSIIVMAGILAGEKSLDKWHRTTDDVNSILAEDQTSSEILALSYHDLPREVKPCFLYFAAFPKDFEVPARQLIRLWLAEGFIQKNRERNVEDIAEDYLENLIDRNLVQVEKFGVDGGVKTCRIHDLLRELCITEAAKENFLESRKEVSPSTSSTGNRRRLSVQCNVSNFILHNSSKLKYVRSIQSFDRDTTSKVGKKHWEAISKGKLLKVLDFGSTTVEEVPNDAEDLLNLRYLKINAPSLKKFPLFLVSLWNLQTLDMRSTKLTNVPDGIYKMQNLRHLFFKGAVKFPKPSSEELGPDWRLKTLSTVALSRETATLVKNGALDSVTRLGLCHSDPEADWNLLDDLHKLPNLQSLKIELQINDFTIWRMMKSVCFPASLIKVTLKDIRLNPEQFEIFGKLPNLRIFKLCKAWGHLMFQKDSFPMIQAFSMVDVTIQSWKLEEGASPYLEHLMFDNCNFNGELPHNALAALAYLKSIRANRPIGQRLDSLATLEGMVKDKCSIVIIPEQWRKYLKNPGNA
ncbi:hypothetical protein Ancab_028442 [Ancistrocladus abbreviatus]